MAVYELPCDDFPDGAADAVLSISIWSDGVDGGVGVCFLAFVRDASKYLFCRRVFVLYALVCA